MFQETKPEYSTDPKIFTCRICNSIFDRPVTLNCGHTFCYNCLSKKLTNDQENSQNELPLVPLCPECQSIIWRPISSLKQNVAINNLISRFNLASGRRNTQKLQGSSETQHQIMVKCAKINNFPMPYCFSQIVFATAFIDQIIEQQAQTNSIVLKWPGASQQLAVAGRILRPQIYHYSMKTGVHQQVYRALFQGVSIVKVKQWQTLDLKMPTSLIKHQATTSPLILCRVDHLQSTNPLPIQHFDRFFNIYDQLNNPVYIRQIAQNVQQKILHDRNDSKALIYCILGILQLQQQEIVQAIKSMDDRVRWQLIQNYLIKNAAKPPEEVIRINIPGNYPHSLVFIILLLLVIIHIAGA